MECGKKRQCALENIWYHNVPGQGSKYDEEMIWGEKSMPNTLETSLMNDVLLGFPCLMNIYFTALGIILKSFLELLNP